jgi:hypothetical protein
MVSRMLWKRRAPEMPVDVTARQNPARTPSSLSWAFVDGGVCSLLGWGLLLRMLLLHREAFSLVSCGVRHPSAWMPRETAPVPRGAAAHPVAWRYTCGSSACRPVGASSSRLAWTLRLVHLSQSWEGRVSSCPHLRSRTSFGASGVNTTGLAHSIESTPWLTTPRTMGGQAERGRQERWTTPKGRRRSDTPTTHSRPGPEMPMKRTADVSIHEAEERACGRWHLGAPGWACPGAGRMGGDGEASS